SATTCRSGRAKIRSTSNLPPGRVVCACSAAARRGRTGVTASSSRPTTALPRLRVREPGAGAVTTQVAENGPITAEDAAYAVDRREGRGPVAPQLVVA